MALISIKRNVDLQPGLNAPAVFNCSQSDKGTTIMLGLMNGGNDYTVPSGVTITIRGSRSNGAVFTPTSATFSGSTVSFTLTEEMTDTAGPTLCEAVLEQGNNVLGTANFIINVEGSPMGADVPPVFTDAAWTWMLGKLTTETVPALGDDVISSIQGKVDKSQGSTNAKKFLRVNTSGNVSLASTDKTLLVADQIADAKETGDQIRALDAEIDGVATTLGGSISTLNGITTDLQSSKLNKNQGTSNAGKTMVVDSSGNIVPGDVPITIDDTLSIADAAADAKAAGDAIALKANASTIAPEFSDQNTYTAGSYVYKNGVLYTFTAAHTGAWTGSDTEVVTVGGEVEDVKTVINSEIGYETTVTASPTLTDGYSIVTSGSNAGAVVTNATNSVSDEIDLTDAKEITFYYTNGNPYGNIFLYDAQNAFISTQGIPSSSNKATITVPQNASYARYFCMTSRKGVVVEIKKEIQGTIYEEIETKQDKNLGVENAGKYLTIDSEGNIYPKALTTDTTKTRYTPFAPVKPLIAEMMADFAWCSMIIPNAFTGKNVTITISGNAGETTVTASTISPDGLTLSDIWTTNWIGGVISPDGVNFTVCNFKYVSGDTIEVFPALSENISGGVLSTLMFDSGSSYVGLHLTENGYKAYMQNLFNKNPKHCEVGKYVARFRPEIDTVSPFVWYGGTIPAAAYRFITKNKALEWLNNPTTKFYGYQYSTQWQEHTTKSGAYWDVDLKGKSGYLEAYVFAICNAFNLPTDQELHVIVTIDGEEKLNQIVDDSVCRRIIVDYENATSGRLEVYSNKWYKVNGQPYGFGFGRVTWWVNDLDYDDSPLFPKGVVIAQEFDSWGVFHNGASGKELERLQNATTGVTVPYTNHSKGDQTSAWGVAWYYENVFAHHPSIAIHDFVINDTNSIDNAGIPATIEGPDEKTYNNKLTSAQYAANMILLGQLSISNGIQPILMSACQHGSTNYYTFTNALIDALSEEVE